MAVRIETERLILRPWEDTEEDVQALFSIASDPNVGVHAGWKPHADLDESRWVMREILLPPGAMSIIQKPEATGSKPEATGSKPEAMGSKPEAAATGGRIIGCTALEPDRLRPDANSRELGYWLVSTEWGKGYMTEAAKAMIAYGFDTLGLDQIGICTSRVNLRSQSVIKKCGFVYEGTIRRTYKIYTGELRDSQVYSMLRSEYEALYK
ncbi:MAG: GNAT family N-acetyltransferase [Firmicutes bacterium]|nr:GNAT family N-acetyltransferase [Bacillota bacterium]